MSNAVPGVTKRDPARRSDSNPERRKGRRWYAAVEGRIGRLTTKYLYPHQTVMTEVSRRWWRPLLLLTGAPRSPGISMHVRVPTLMTRYAAKHRVHPCCRVGGWRGDSIRRQVRQPLFPGFPLRAASLP